MPAAQEIESTYQGPSGQSANGSQSTVQSTSDLTRANSIIPKRSQSQSIPMSNPFGSVSNSTSSQTSGLSSSPSNKFKGIRDLEERDYGAMNEAGGNAAQRKEGLVWALSRPGTHIDPRGLNKQAWHK